MTRLGDDFVPDAVHGGPTNVTALAETKIEAVTGVDVLFTNPAIDPSVQVDAGWIPAGRPVIVNVIAPLVALTAGIANVTDVPTME
jgi:hypothetical protein